MLFFCARSLAFVGLISVIGVGCAAQVETRDSDEIKSGRIRSICQGSAITDFTPLSADQIVSSVPTDTRFVFLGEEHVEIVEQQATEFLAEADDSVAGRRLLEFKKLAQSNVWVRNLFRDALPGFRTRGFTHLTVELPVEHQPCIDGILAGRPNTSDTCGKFDDTMTLRPGILGLIQRASELGMKVLAIDVDQFHKDSPFCGVLAKEPDTAVRRDFVMAERILDVLRNVDHKVVFFGGFYHGANAFLTRDQAEKIIQLDAQSELSDAERELVVGMLKSAALWDEERSTLYEEGHTLLTDQFKCSYKDNEPEPLGFLRGVVERNDHKSFTWAIYSVTDSPLSSTGHGQFRANHALYDGIGHICYAGPPTETN